MENKSTTKQLNISAVQLSFDFVEPGFISLSKIAVEHPIDLRMINDSSIHFDWIGIGPNELLRNIISGIEAIATVKFPQASDRVRSFPGAFRDEQGQGHLSVELGLACNNDDSSQVLPSIRMASVGYLKEIFSDVRLISGSNEATETAVVDTILRDMTTLQSSIVRKKYKDKAVPMPLVITIGEQSYLCQGRIKGIINAASPTKKMESISGLLTAVSVSGERYIIIKTRDRGSVTINCRSRDDIRKVRPFIDEEVHIQLEVEVTYEAATATACSLVRCLDAYTPNLV